MIGKIIAFISGFVLGTLFGAIVIRLLLEKLQGGLS